MIYFDNASTTPVSKGVIDGINDIYKNFYANPSSLHSFGFAAEKKLNEAREIISKAIKAEPGEIFFTSGGTEANNTAIFGCAKAYKRDGRKVITTKIEHPSVTESFNELKNMGYDVLYAPVDDMGYVITEELEKLLTEDVILVSIMRVNNEIGTIQKTEEIGRLIKNKTNAVFHVDNVQGFAKHRLSLKYVDLMTMSSHKIHGTKGCGALYIKKGTKIKSLIFGGSQQASLRPGTENTAGIFAMGIACKEGCDKLDENYSKVLGIKQTLYNELAELEGVYVNGDYENASPYILSLSFEGIKGEVLLHSLEEREIYVSTGAACSERAKKHNSVMDYLDKSKKDNTVRFSFSAVNDEAEARQCAAAIKDVVPMLRRYKRR